MAAFDWLTGDSSEARAARRERRVKEAAEAQLRAEEHVAWLKSLSPAERRAYDLQQEVDRLAAEKRKLEKKNENLTNELSRERQARWDAEFKARRFA